MSGILLPTLLDQGENFHSRSSKLRGEGALPLQGHHRDQAGVGSPDPDRCQAFLSPSHCSHVRQLQHYQDVGLHNDGY
ncbi:hypothetical protein NDU88_003355 [Pleurodeles waltl]|uniref:Uncharacterized protein n=1 Tax=Pleurodeles waltl TaxID=8319 RepID=A0AAV7M6P8_PLEWA|nr:hypothetical protein NDU88_003355 [Pleurodeles waltl]